MRTLGLALALGAAACGMCAAAQDSDQARRESQRGRHGLRPLANPSAIVAAELAFARAAQEKGQWTAFRQYADDGAIMFTPGQVVAKDWLKGRADPPMAVKWQPYDVWMSCDASLAVSKGAWQRPDSVGYFTTVWKRRKNGDYKWVLDQGDNLAQPLPEPEMIGGHLADCSRPTAPGFPAAAGRAAGWSDDRTLGWVVDVKADFSRTFRVLSWNGSSYDEVLHADVAAG